MADPYVYPGTDILKNKGNRKTLEALKAFERNKSIVRVKQLEENPKLAAGNFDLKHLQRIHNYIFQDVYEWAGKNRTVDISKGSNFCPAQNIESFAEDIFKIPARQDYFKNMDKETFAKNAAMLLGEINALHPFREGNGRTQREFLRQLALQAGYKLDFKNVSQEEMIKASIESFNLKYNSMIDIFTKSLEKLPEKKISQKKETRKNKIEKGQSR